MRAHPAASRSLSLAAAAISAALLIAAQLGCRGAEAAPGDAPKEAPKGAPKDADKDPEQAAVRAAVELYFRGHATGNGDFFRRAFHPEAKLFWVKDGAFAQRTSAEFAAGASGKPPEDEAKRVRRILLVDVSGDAAIAKVELDYPTGGFIDYLSLLKVGGAWVIVNKIFHRVPAVRSR